MPTKQQIGKCGEILVQYRLLMQGIESSQLTTDTGIDLVAYIPSRRKPISIQVKSNYKPKPGGGKGKLALDWWILDDSPADAIALVDLSKERIWLVTTAQIGKLAQQHSNGRYHLYMYVDPSAKPSKSALIKLDYQFSGYLIENVLPTLL